MRSEFFDRSSKPCPICGSKFYKVVFESTFDPKKHLNKTIFSARRSPDKIHGTIIKCVKCGLVITKEEFNQSILAELYKKSSFSYQSITNNLISTYGKVLNDLDEFVVKKDSYLEIGCGNGFLLEEAKRKGFKKIVGLEPSYDAINKSDKKNKKSIRRGILTSRTFAPRSFDAISAFQVFDHISKPNEFLKICHNILKKNGVIVLMNHDVQSFSAKLLREKSPIFDIEHPYLYSQKTISDILIKNGFKIEKIYSPNSLVSLSHILHLLPISKGIKKSFSKLKSLRKVNISLKLGNLCVIARKMENSAVEKNINVFSKDVGLSGSYQYTKKEKLSSYLANKYITSNISAMIDMRNKKIIDIGCGDGAYTKDYIKKKPKSMIGFDPSIEAISSAKRDKTKINFIVGSIYDFNLKNKQDVAIVRGVIHHLYTPQKAFSNIKHLAGKVIIIEPNGYNPILKIIEKISPYHREHEEKSYTSFTLDRWIKENGGIITKRKFAGLVPFFCPDWMAKILKKIEPVVESIPIINALACANYYVVYETR